MNCKVTLSGSNGTSLNTFGILTSSGAGFELKYKIEGDDCSLSVRDGTVAQSRRGALDFDINFIKGANTFCIIYSGESTGTIPVKTLDLYTSETDDGVLIKIVYLLGGEKMNINISAACI